MYVKSVSLGREIFLEIESCDDRNDAYFIAALLVKQGYRNVSFWHNGAKHEVSSDPHLPIYFARILKKAELCDLKIKSHYTHLRRKIWSIIEVNQKLLKELEIQFEDFPFQNT